MSTELGRKAGVFFLGAAALSLLFPRLRLNQAAVVPQSSPPATPPRPPRRMWALVQILPDLQVLAVSASRAELERELSEINETWNHCELRAERQRYVIQAAPVLFPAPPEPGARVAAPPGRERTEG